MMSKFENKPRKTYNQSGRESGRQQAGVKKLSSAHTDIQQSAVLCAKLRRKAGLPNEHMANAATHFRNAILKVRIRTRKVAAGRGGAQCLDGRTSCLTCTKK